MELTRMAALAADFLLSVSLRTLPIFAVAGLACLGLRRASAASRHLLWAVTLVGLFCLPVLCALLPPLAAPVLPSKVRLRIVAPPAAQPVVGDSDTSAPALPPTLPSADGSHAASSTLSPSVPDSSAVTAKNELAPQSPPPVPFRPVPFREVTAAHHPAPIRITGAEWLCLVWLTGVIMMLTRIVVGLAGAGCLIRRCHPLAASPAITAIEEARLRLGVKVSMSVREGTAAAPVAVPMTFGGRRPVVLLPAGADGWPAERLRVVMMHEMAHIGRRDWITLMLAQAVLTLYWFHPLVWLTARCLRTEAEAACDDLVLTHGVNGPDYATHLLEVVRGLVGRRVPSAVVTMAYSHEIKARLTTILAEHKDRGAVGRHRWPLVLITTAALLVPLAALRPVSSAPPQSSGTSTMREPVPITIGAVASDARVSAMMARHSKWEEILPNGIRVRLLAAVVSNTRGEVECCWTPDGAMTVPLNTQLVRTYGPGSCLFLCGIVFPSARLQNGATVSGGEAGGSPGWTEGVSSWHNGQAVSINIGPNSPNAWAGTWAGQERGALELTIASGPKTTLIAAPSTQEATRHLSTGELVMLSRPVVHQWPALHRQVSTTEVTATLPSRFVRHLTDYSFEVIGRDGRPLRVQHAGTSEPDTSKQMTHISFSFRTSEAPSNRVKEIRLTYRLSQSVTFRNVALRPKRNASSNAASNPMTSSATVDAGPVLPNSIATAPGDTGFVLPPRIAAALAGDTSWKRTLPDGTQVKMVSVSALDAHYQPGQSWKPDGTPLGTGASSRVTAAAPAHLSYQFLVVCPSVTRMVGACMAYGRVGDMGGAESVPPWRKQRWAVLNYPEGVPAPQPQEHVALQVSVATGPETTLVSGSPFTGAVRRLPTGETVVLSQAILHSPGEAHQDGHPVDTTEVDFTLPARFVRHFCDYRFMIIGQDGKPLSAQHSGGGRPIVSGRTAQMRYDFRSAEVPLSRVKEFRLTYRPSGTAIFQGVAVRPKGKTAMAVPTHSASPLTASLSQTHDPFDPNPSSIEQTRQGRIEAAVSLRQYLQGWSLQHAALLRQMRRARPVDIPAILRVVPRMSLPGRPPNDLHDRSQSPPAGLVFADMNAPLPLSRLREFQRPSDMYTREDLAKYQDLRLLESKSTGRSHITLWASGRVTETTLVNRSEGRGKSNVTERVESIELAPPYEFLFPQSSF